MEKQKDFRDIIGPQFAQRLSERHHPFGWTASDQEVVLFQDAGTYVLNADLKRILSPGQGEVAATTLEELRLLNNEFSGVPVINALAKLELSGELLALSELIWEWMQQYIDARIRKDNPKDLNPVRKFKRLCTEYYDLIVDPYFKPDTIGHPLRTTFAKRVIWVLSERILQKHYTVQQIPHGAIIVTDTDTAELINQSEAEAFFEAVKVPASFFRWHFNLLPSFFFYLQQGMERARQSHPVLAFDRDELVCRIADLAKDVADLRCFLAGSKPGNIHVEIGDVVVGLSWSAIDGLFELHLGRSEAEMRKNMFCDDVNRDDTSDCAPKVIVRYDGLVADCYRPDVTSATICAHDDWLEFNFLLLQRIHARLYSIYDGIDFDKQRESALTGNFSDDDEISVLAGVCLQLAENAVETVSSPAPPIDENFEKDTDSVSLIPKWERRVRRLRLEQLTKVLRQFDCNIETAKGSELKICRVGKKPFKFGRHVMNPEISVNTLLKMLNRLGIDKRQFIRAAYS